MQQSKAGGSIRRDPTKQVSSSGARLISPKNNQFGTAPLEDNHHQVSNALAGGGASSNYKAKSISSGRKQGQTHGANHHHASSSPSQPGTISNSVTPMLQSAQSMSSLQKPFNGNGGRVLISPSNFQTVRAPGGTQSGMTVNNLGGTMQTQQLTTSSSSRRHGHGSGGKMISHVPPPSGSTEAQNLVAKDSQSQSYLQQLRKSQISALRQLKKPAGEQLQPAKIDRHISQGGNQHTSQASYNTKNSLSDRHLVSHPKQGSSDQLLQHQREQQQLQSQPTQLESEYGSIGRQDQKIRFYQSNGGSNHHPMSRQAAAGNGVAVTSNKGSDENSDDFQAVAEEDIGSFMLHRNAYLDGDIMAVESQLFKQQPKQGRDPRPNPNTQNGKSQVQATNATGSSGMAYQRGYSSQKQLITGSVASQLSQNSGGRLSSQNMATPMHVEEISLQCPNSKQHTSENKQRRKQSMNALGQGSNTTNAATGSKSNRKSQQFNNLGQSSTIAKPQINTLAGPTDYQPQVRAFTNLAAPASYSQQPLFNPNGAADQALGAEQALGSASEQKRRAQKGLQRVETITQMGMQKPQYPMFPLEDNKKAMIQFEMNLLARANKQAAASYSLRQQQSDSQPGTTLLNKATLCDSSNSKQNSQNSAFLRKSLWLLTSLKNKALKEVVNNQQASCQACHYLRKQGVGCFAQNQAIQTPSINHAQTFIYNQNDSQTHGGSILIKNNSITNANKAQSLVVTLPVEKQSVPNTANSNVFVGSSLKTSAAKKDGSSGVYSRQQQVQKRHSQKQRTTAKHTSHTGIIDKTHGGISSQGVNWLGSMGTQCLLVEAYEHDFWKLLTQRTLNTKYLTSQEYYNSKIAADIMYNEQRHIVSVFKEYLIFDDFSEYLKRFYSFKEAQDRLPRVFEFYEHYSKVFPNYVSVPESKYMFKNIERKQKLIDQRHQIYMKNQAAKEGIDGKSGNYKHSANMLFGSQFLREVYADDDKSLSQISIDKKKEQQKNGAATTDKKMKMFETPNYNLRHKMMEHNSEIMSPQAQQAQNAKKIHRRGEGSLVEASMARHQNELENVISMLSRFEQSRRGEESMSITVSRSYIEGANVLGNNPKETPQSVAVKADASRKKLGEQKKKNKNLASHQNLQTIKKKRTDDPFPNGWNFNEPTHDLSMSSWALTSFIKNGDEQPSGVLGMGSIIDTDTANPFIPDEISIDDFAVITGAKRRDGETKIVPDKEAYRTEQKNKKRLSLHTEITTQVTQGRSVKANEVLNQQATPAGAAALQSKQPRKVVDYRRNSAMSPKVSDTSKGMQSIALMQKSNGGDQKNSGHLLKSSRAEKDKIKQTPLRDEKASVKKKATAVGKTGAGASNNLANSRCRSKLSIGSAQTQSQQTMSKKAAQNQNNKKHIERMIKDSSLKLQIDKNNRHIVSLQKRTGTTTTTNQQSKAQGSVNQHLAALANSNEQFNNITSGQSYNTHQVMSMKTPKSSNQPGGGVNSSRNAKISQTSTAVKSNSQLASAAAPGATVMETQSAYKSSGHIPSTLVQGTKALKTQGYEDAKGINERFIDLNKASEGAPKISKPALANQVIKSSDFSSVKGSSQGIRLGDQSAKNNQNGGNLLGNVNNHTSHNSVRANQHSLGFRKSIENNGVLVVNQNISPISTGSATKLQGQVKTVQRTYHSRPITKAEAMNSDVNQNSQTITHAKSPQTQTQSQSNLPQIFKKEQKSEAKQIRPSAYDIQVKTIFKHENSSNFASVPASQQSQHYNKKKSSPDQSQHQIHFNAQHTSSKSHEPVDRQSKSESKQQLLHDHMGHQASTTANSVIGHNSQHCLMLVSQNNNHQMMNQAASSGPQSSQNVRMSNKDHHGKLEGNMLIQNSILHKNSSLLSQQISNGMKNNNNPYSKTGRILNSLNQQKQSVQSLGHMSSTSGTGSHHVKGGRNQKLNVKSTPNNHMLKGTTAQSVSSSSSIGSSKISMNSAHHKSDNSQIYLKTLSRGHNVNHLNSGKVVVRKTPSGSNSSSKTKKLKVTTTSGTAAKPTKIKVSNTKGGSVAQNPYPAGASHGHTIFSVTMPRQSLANTINQGMQQTREQNRLNNHH